MPVSENNTPPPQKSYKLIFALLTTALLLWVAPFAFISFNDKALALLVQRFPKRETILGNEGKLLESRIKSPYDFIFSSELKNYAPYQSIPLRFALSDKNLGKVITNLQPIVHIYKEDGSPMSDIFNRIDIPLQFDPQQNLYMVEFFPGDSSYHGRIDVRAEVSYSAFSVPIYEDLSLWIGNPSSTYKLPNSSVFLGLESKELVGQRRILAPNNKEASFSSIYDWIPLLNIDAVILQGAFSKTYGVRGDEIWDEEKLSESESIAAALAQKNIKTGLIVQAMELDGIDITRLNYTETKTKDRTSAQTERSIVSLLDSKRPRDISKILTRFQKDENISFLGLSKMFFGDSYNNELRAYFNNFRKGIPVDDMMFRRWKEYRAVSTLRTILSEVEGNKPYFMMLTHNDLLETPAILDMAFAAGVSFVILDVKVSAAERQIVMEKLRPITEPYHKQVIFSLQIDYNDFAGGEDSPIEVWKDRSLMWVHSENFQGLYINDLYKAMFGRRGSYPAFEWMLGIAATTSAFKQKVSGMSLAQKIVASTRKTSPSYQLSFELRNIGLRDITNMNIDLMPTVDVSDSNMYRVLSVPSLKKGEVIRTNITLSNIMLKPNVLQQKYRFLSFRTEYTTDNNRINQIELLSFEDPNAEPDRPYQNVVLTNRPLNTEAPTQVGRPASETPAPRRAPSTTATVENNTNTVDATTNVPEEPKKMSFFERQRLRRLERQKEKDAEDD